MRSIERATKLKSGRPSAVHDDNFPISPLANTPHNNKSVGYQWIWADITHRMASKLGAEVFQALLQTPSYTTILRKGGLRDPFRIISPFPSSFQETWRIYASLIVAEVKQAGSLAEVKATVISGPVTLYRAMDSHSYRPDDNDLCRDTKYFGDWWFTEALQEECRTRCKALEERRRQDPLLTTMAQGQCLRVLLRRKLAIKKDWSRVGALRKLVLNASDRIPAIVGVGIAMGIDSKPDARLPAASGMLPGGANQIWIPFTPNRDMPLWTPPGGFGQYAKLGS
jgi:hypothetical protein